MISHDLSMVARYTDRVIVMRRARSSRRAAPRPAGAAAAPYTRKLLDAMPRRCRRKGAGGGAPLVEVRNLVVDYAGRRKPVRQGGAASARCTASTWRCSRARWWPWWAAAGSGKTTLGRVIAGLVKPSGGDILFAARWSDRRSGGWRDYRLQLPDGVPGPVFLAGSAHDDRAGWSASAAACPRPDVGAEGRAAWRSAGGGRAWPGLRTRYPHELVRRPAPARGDRPRHRAAAEIRDRRRAGVGAGHDGARADPGPVRGPAARTASPACSSATTWAWSSRWPTAWS
jgi:energy-coupling factor transporter ATP-binding protein EcfA2